MIIFICPFIFIFWFLFLSYFYFYFYLIVIFYIYIKDGLYVEFLSLDTTSNESRGLGFNNMTAEPLPGDNMVNSDFFHSNQIFEAGCLYCTVHCTDQIFEAVCPLYSTLYRSDI